MDDLMARTMVENLSIGIDPLTVRALSPRDCCSNEFVQEALRIVLDNCSLEYYGTILERRREEREKEKQERKERRAERYPNAGKAWTKEEDRRLCYMYVLGRKNKYRIANILQRTPNSIAARLKKLGIW